MPGYRKILIAHDGSASGKNALMQAIRLAGAERSWIKILVVAPAYEGDLDITGVADIREALRGPARKLVAEAKAIAGKEGAPTVATNLEEGEPYDRIVSVAGEENCDLIVVGRRGMGRIERALMGSVTARVIGHTKKDVLVVPHDSKIGWKSLILAADGSPSSGVAAERAIAFAKTYGSSLTIVSVVDVTEEFFTEAPELVEKLIEKAKETVKAVAEKAASAGVKTETFVKEGETYRHIVDLASAKKADIIFMGSRGKTGIKKLLLGSVAEKVIGYAPCPVLVVKA